MCAVIIFYYYTTIKYLCTGRSVYFAVYFSNLYIVHSVLNNTLRDAQNLCLRHKFARYDSGFLLPCIRKELPAAGPVGDLCSQKTPRGILPVNSNKSVFLFNIRIFLSVYFAHEHVVWSGADFKRCIECLVDHQFLAVFCMMGYCQDFVEIFGGVCGYPFSLEMLNDITYLDIMLWCF